MGWNRWTHGHTAATGLVAGLYMAHGWPLLLLLGLLFAAGVGAGRVWKGLHAVKETVGGELTRRRTLEEEKIRTERARRRDLLASAKLTRKRLKDAVDQAYRQGIQDTLLERGGGLNG